ncbi:replication protein A 32 kDa subunit A isoform X2 [Corylus avellana]|uniref:replication protein A 32 kDa subunit A isoform X2 n=1 Tax=Corylus avellana TaxID=13451 RepID=UPI00286D614A|nr:replication protein A 32 kDa subunit A isoform X2 [Corylus avellana]
MFSSSQFESNSAFSGGGFTFSHQSQPSDSDPSPAKSRETQGLVPVTVKQISEASQSGDEKSTFVINGVDVANVTLVGMVFDKLGRNTDVGFNLDDGTGRIGCRRWINENFDTTEMEKILDGMYVRVNGHLKSFKGVKQVVAFSVRPVTNFDEVAFHFIDCIHNHLQSKSQLQGVTPIQPQSVDMSFNTPVKNESTGYQTAPSTQLSGQFSSDGLKSCDQLVLDYLQQPSSIGQEKGIHRDELSQHLKLPVDKIMYSIRALEEEGLIYSTIDEFHYKSTACG